MEEAPVIEKIANHNQIKVTLPDNSKPLSSHKCKLPLQNVPSPANEGYILPGMKNHSLISVTKLCNAGCEVIFSKNECVVKHKGNEVTRGIKHTSNGL
jgi:hypothetical protein